MIKDVAGKGTNIAEQEINPALANALEILKEMGKNPFELGTQKSSIPGKEGFSAAVPKILEENNKAPGVGNVAELAATVASRTKGRVDAKKSAVRVMGDDGSSRTA